MHKESQAVAESKILDKIKDTIGIAGKESGRYKIYFLKNGNVAYVRYSDIRYSCNRPYGTYYFIVSIDKFNEYKERFKLVLICGSFDRTFIIPSEDIEYLFKNVSISTTNQWYFRIYPNMTIDKCDVDLSKYLNNWDLLGKVEVMEGNMEDNIRSADIRTKIYEIVSRLSKENKKCNHNYLCNDLYHMNYGKFEISAALRHLEEKDAIYKIVYVDWYIKEKYRDSDPQEEDKLLVDAFAIIKDFSSKHKWQYGLKKSDLYFALTEKGYAEDDIKEALRILEERKIIYKRHYIYWFTKEYKGEELKGDLIEEKEDIIYMPDKIEDNNIEKLLDDLKLLDEEKENVIKNNGDHTIENEEIKIEDEIFISDGPYSDLLSKVQFLTKKLKGLGEEKEKLEYDKQKEITIQKELERKLTESINRQKEIDIKLLDINKEKEDLEKIFEPIIQTYDKINLKVVEEKKVLGS